MAKKAKSEKKSDPKKTGKKAAAATKTAEKPKAATKPKTAAKRTTKPRTASKAAFTEKDVALRAYFLGEERQRKGLPGNSEDDWVEAERQLAAESKPKRAATRKKPVAK